MFPTMTSVSTHVLDTVSGLPARGVPVELQALRGSDWQSLASGTTDDDGRVSALCEAAPGIHRLVFETAAYFQGDGFFPEVTVTFEITAERRLHVPLLLSRFGYTVYRGS
jgi:5-hydroxyisourate hydrolase